MRSASFRSFAYCATFLLAAAVIGSCTLTGPLDGYTGGEVKEAGTGSDVFVPCGTPGYADCDGIYENGCETPTDNDPNNCGQCFKICTADAGDTPSCANGMCGTGTCPGGTADCDENPANLCETDIATQVKTCGSCTKTCSFPNATPKCDKGVCLILACTGSFKDCDQQAETGCEMDTSTSVQHCGECKKVCAGGDNAQPVCTAGNCGLKCATGYEDCDKQANNGCEIALSTDVAHCGACTTACSTAGGTASCVNGSCKIACTGNNANCDNNVENGCEADLQADAKNCGTCGQGCLAPPNATPLCTNGSCAWKCDAMSGDCNSSTPDGCETNLTNDSANCGACKHDCLGTTCESGLCQSATIANNLNRPTSLVVDATNVFWTDLDQGVLYKAPKLGGSPEVFADMGAAAAIATNGVSVFWFTGSLIAKIPAAGGMTGVLVNQSDVTALAADADSVFWLKEGSWPQGVYQKDGAVMRVSANGGAATVLVPGQDLPVALAADSNSVYWVNRGTAPNDGSIFKMAKTGGVPTTLASKVNMPCGLAINSSQVFWVVNCVWDPKTPLAQTLMRVPKGGGTPSQVVANRDISGNVVADDSFVFWTFPGFENLDHQGGSVSKVAVSGGDPIVLASKQNHSSGITFDAQRIYWANAGTMTEPPPGNGSIMRVAK